MRKSRLRHSLGLDAGQQDEEQEPADEFRGATCLERDVLQKQGLLPDVLLRLLVELGGRNPRAPVKASHSIGALLIRKQRHGLKPRDGRGTGTDCSGCAVHDAHLLLAGIANLPHVTHYGRLVGFAFICDTTCPLGSMAEARALLPFHGSPLSLFSTPLLDARPVPSRRGPGLFRLLVGGVPSPLLTVPEAL